MATSSTIASKKTALNDLEEVTQTSENNRLQTLAVFILSLLLLSFLLFISMSRMLPHIDYLWQFVINLVLVLSLLFIILILLPLKFDYKVTAVKVKRAAMRCIYESLFGLIVLMRGGYQKFPGVMEDIGEYYDNETCFSYKEYLLFGAKTYIIRNESLAHFVLAKTGVLFERIKLRNTAKHDDSVLGVGSGTAWRRIKAPFIKYFNRNLATNQVFDEIQIIVDKYVLKWVELSKSYDIDIEMQLALMFAEIRFSVLFNMAFDDELHQLIELNQSENAYGAPDFSINNKQEWGQRYYESLKDLIYPTDMYSFGSNYVGNGNGNSKNSQFVKQWYLPLIHKSNINSNAPAGDDKSLNGLCQQLLKDEILSVEEINGFKSLICYAIAPSYAVFWGLYTLFNEENSGYLVKCRECGPDDDVYLRACMKEVFRLYPPVPCIMTRTAIQDTKFVYTSDDSSDDSSISSTIEIKKGSKLVVSANYIQHSKYLWENPNQFDPTRFLQSPRSWNSKVLFDGKTNENDTIDRPSNVNGKNKQLRYLPFGFGQHQCQGRYFADKEVLLVMKSIISKYNVIITTDGGLSQLPPAKQGFMEEFFFPVKKVKVKFEKI